MTLKTHKHNYIYKFKYDVHHTALCKLESRQLFGEEETDKVLFSNFKIDPSISPFIRCRFEMILSTDDYPELLNKIERENIQSDGFKVEYLVLSNDNTTYADRLKKLKDIGFVLIGLPDFKKPTITYAVCFYENTWHFGILIKHNTDLHKHRKKPCSFSNSIGMNIAKTLVSIASKGHKANYLLDACCGVGTVMLEACGAGFKIDGCDINWKASRHARENLEHYHYTAEVYRSDIKDLQQKYDAIIVDLPYNLYSYSNDIIILNIIESAARLTDRMIIVSISDIEKEIHQSGLKISDFCKVEKRGKSTFTRNIWVCEKSVI